MKLTTEIRRAAARRAAEKIDWELVVRRKKERIKNHRGNINGKGGFSDNPTTERLLARKQCAFKRGNRLNPFGTRGFRPNSAEKLMEKELKPLRLKSLMDAREFQEKCRGLGAKALEVIEAILENPASSDQAKLTAINFIAERGWGKATQTTIQANIDTDAKPGDVDAAELDNRIKSTIQRIERLTERKRETLDSEERPTDIRRFN